MRGQWLAMEHSRLHAVESWPEGPRKRAALASIRSKLASLAATEPVECCVCRERSVARLVELRPTPSIQDAPIDVAA